ncbi:zinc finger protein [Trichonephila clavipes]|nr:zinc finger protein [Trichonephila clavipes]
MRISHKRLTIWKTTFTVLLPIYGHKCWKKSSKIGRPDWTTSEPAVAVLCQKSYLKYDHDSLAVLVTNSLRSVTVSSPGPTEGSPRCWRPMHFKSVEVQCPPFDVVVRRRRCYEEASF